MECKGIIIKTIDKEGVEQEHCHQLYYLYDPFWWLKPEPDPWKLRLRPQPLPWKEALQAELAKIKSQPEQPSDIADIEVLATMALLTEKLSPAAKRSMYKQLNETVKRILPKEIAVEFCSAASVEQKTV